MVLTICQNGGYEFAYMDDPSVQRMRDCTPCSVLYELYLSQAHKYNHMFLRTPTLSRQQFGVALNVACEGTMRTQRVRRHDPVLGDVRILVYAGVRGPNSFYHHTRRGRPTRDD